MHLVNLMRQVPRAMVSGLVCLILLLYVFSVGYPFWFAKAATSSFGHTSIGTSSTASFNGLYVCNFTSPPDLENITQIEIYLATDGTTARAVIYSDNNGTPDILLAESEETSVVGTSGKWVSFKFSYAGTPNTTYWLGAILHNGGVFYYSAGVSGRAVYFSFVTDTPSVFPYGNVSPATDLSVYAFYTPSAAPIVPDQNFNWVQMLLLLIAILGLIIGAILRIVYPKINKKKI
jgi:hypothetical protein